MLRHRVWLGRAAGIQIGPRGEASPACSGSLACFGRRRRVTSVVRTLFVVVVLGGGLVLIGPAVARPSASSGCPAAAGKAPFHGARCVRLSVRLIVKTKVSNGGCGRYMVMQVPLHTAILEYVAQWTNFNKGAVPWTFTSTNGGPYGDPWSTTAITSQNTGDNLFESYEVPKGYGAWFVDAGGGPGPCSTQTGTAVAWAWRSGSG
jgi:hypothetical protein